MRNWKLPRQPRVQPSDSGFTVNHAGFTVHHAGFTVHHAGFTLIEILIVISIIALLSSMVLVAITKARGDVSAALAKTAVSGISNALENYIQDEADYPGWEVKKIDAETNLFPYLYDALFGEPRPNGRGGRNAPYMKIEEKNVAIWDDDSETYVTATKDDIDAPRVKKYLLDPWGNPYIYRPNKGKKKESWMHNARSADIYSCGPNGEDDTAAENHEDSNDDIGNW
jgi:general secretion pathway protein G